jgi:hypothetical protein
MSGLKKEVSDNGKSIVKLSTQLDALEKRFRGGFDNLEKRLDDLKKSVDNTKYWLLCGAAAIYVIIIFDIINR